MVQAGACKALYAGSNPAAASNLFSTWFRDSDHEVTWDSQDLGVGRYRRPMTAPQFSPHGARLVSDVEVSAWAANRQLAAFQQGAQSYFPRFKNRDPFEAVSHPSLISPINERVGAHLSTILMNAAPRGALRGLKLIQPENMHVTGAWINPGENRTGDLAQLDLAREAAPAVHQVAAQIAPIKLRAIRLAVLRNQIVVVYGAPGWNQVTDAAAQIRGAVPELDKGGYPKDKGPLEMGPVVQTTLAVVADEEADVAGLAEALSENPQAWPLGGVEVELDRWLLVEHVHNRRTIMSKGEIFADAPFTAGLSQDEVAAIPPFEEASISFRGQQFAEVGLPGS